MRVRKAEVRRRRFRPAVPVLLTLLALGVFFAVAATLELPPSAPTAPAPVRVALNPGPPRSQATEAGHASASAAAGVADAPLPAEHERTVDAQPPKGDGSIATAAASGSSPAASPGAPTQRGAGENGTFLGVRDSYRRVVIAFDVADSVRRKAAAASVPLETIRDEAARLIASLDGQSAFSIIQFVRRYETFSEGLVAATPESRAAALDWLREEFRTDGRSGSGWVSGEPDGIELVIRAALKMEPEVLFIISDGDFQRTVGRGGQDVDWQDIEDLIGHWQINTRHRVRVHIIGIAMETEAEAAARRLTQRFGGQLRLLK